MDQDTLDYVKGRFRDYYTRTQIETPPKHDKREWASLSFDQNMNRHLSLFDIGSLDEWIIRETPRHVYYSSAIYESPGARKMEEKNWKGADLIFDLDADHLKRVDESYSYSESLEACKQELFDLLSFLTEDFGYEDLQIVFSGGRGYHVHVRDEEAKKLNGEGRREIVDYIEGNGVSLDSVMSKDRIEGSYGAESVEVRYIRGGGWGKRVREYIKEIAERVASMDEDDAIDFFTKYEGIGKKSARKLKDAFKDRREEIQNGEMDVVGIPRFWEALTEEAVEKNRAEIDEPVTTDTKRLIRLPGSIHGGTGFKVKKIKRDNIEEFDPLEDSLIFSGHDIEVLPETEITVNLGGKEFKIQEGKKTSVPEFVAIFLILRGNAKLA